MRWRPRPCDRTGACRRPSSSIAGAYPAAASPTSTISDPLEAEPNVDLMRVHPGTALPGDVDLVIPAGLRKPRLPDSTRCGSQASTSTSRRYAKLRRHSDRAVRRLSDARPHGGRSERRRRLPQARRRPGLLDVETVLDGWRRRSLHAKAHDQRRHAVHRLRDAQGRAQRRTGSARPFSPIVDGARSRPTAASSAPTCTGCSAMTGSARHGCNDWAQAQPLTSRMKNWWKPRSTGCRKGASTPPCRSRPAAQVAQRVTSSVSDRNKRDQQIIGAAR